MRQANMAAPFLPPGSNSNARKDQVQYGEHMFNKMFYKSKP